MICFSVAVGISSIKAIASSPRCQGEAFPPISYQLKSNIYCGNALPLQIYVGENINLNTGMLRPDICARSPSLRSGRGEAFRQITYD